MLPRLQHARVSDRCAPVPGADVLADIAAENMAAVAGTVLLAGFAGLFVTAAVFAFAGALAVSRVKAVR